MPPGGKMYRFSETLGENAPCTREARMPPLQQKTERVWKSTNTNLQDCRAYLTVILNHPRRGFHNCQLLIVNCQFIC